MIFDGGWILVK